MQQFVRVQFYELTDAEPDLASLQVALLDWETTYNTVRPHQALRSLTPTEYLATLEAMCNGRTGRVQRLEATSGDAYAKAYV